MMMKNEKLNISDQEITNHKGHQIMMCWETPLMNEMADEVCKNGGDILEVGFGMGISADRIQQNKIDSHTIVEINKQVYNKAKNWCKSKSVTIVNDDFSNYLNYCNRKFDGIFFDPFPSEILGVGIDEFVYGMEFFDKIKKICKENCLIVPFLPATSKNLDYLIDYVPLKSITTKSVDLGQFVNSQYFRGDRASVYVFNI